MYNNIKPVFVIIGGGAAGFMAAITCKENAPNARVIILEKSKNVLAKVKVSGGGRCNVTNAETNPVKLSKFYPRTHLLSLLVLHQKRHQVRQLPLLVNKVASKVGLLDPELFQQLHQ